MRRRLLVVSPFAPRLDATHGGGRAIAQLLQALSAGNTISLICCRAEGEPPPDPELMRVLERIEEVRRPVPGPALRRAALLAGLARGRPTWATRWRVPGLTDRIARSVAAWQPDVVQLEYHVMGRYIGAVARTVPTVLVEYEPGAAAALEAAAARPGSLVLRADAWAWRRFERRVAEAASAVVAFTERDRASVAAVAPHARVTTIPLGVDIPPRAADPHGVDGRVLFVGNAVHPPNRDAVQRLVGDIMPRVRRAVPAAKLDLVGPGMPAELAGDGVEVHGQVPDVAPWLDAAAVVAAPLRQGGGMRLKVMEALAAGKAVVATSRALEGLDARDGDQVRIADGDDAIAAAIVELLSDPEERMALARRARAWAEASLGWAAIAARYDALYTELIARHR